MPRSAFEAVVVEQDEVFIQRAPTVKRPWWTRDPDYVREETIIKRGNGPMPPSERGRLKVRVEHRAREPTPQRDRGRPHHGHVRATEARHVHDLEPKRCRRWLDARRHDLVRECTVYNRNREIHHTDGNVRISPMLTKSKKYPPGFSHSKRLVDFMRLHDDELNDIMKAYNLDPKWHTWRDEWTGRWARRSGRYPLSVDFMKNLELLFGFLGADHIADRLRMVRHDHHARGWWNEDFRIRRI